MQLLRLRSMCLDEYGRVVRFPDGGSLLDQPSKLLQAFAVISDTFEMLRTTR